MKVKTNRLIASGLFSLLFIGEMYLTLTVMNQFGTASLAVAHLLVIGGMLLLPVFAVLIANPCFDRPAVRAAVLYAGVLYLCGSTMLYNGGSMLYATGLGSETQTIGYYLVGAKVVLIAIALALAAFEPKKAEKVEEVQEVLDAPANEPPAEEELTAATGCGEDTAAEITDEEAGKMGL